MKTLKEIYEYRQMIFGLVHRDLKGRYKGSALGFLWTFLNPLLQLLVYTFLFSVILKSNIDKYYLHLFVALVPWIFFSTSINAGSGCVLNQSALVTKIYFPREVLPISHVTAAFINMMYTFVVLLAVVFISGVHVSFAALLCLPVIMLIEYALALGLCLIVSSITVYLRDMEYITGVLLMLWQFLCPIMYSINIVPAQYLSLYNLNPMTSVIVAYRDILYYGRVPHFKTLLLACAMGVGFLIVGFYIFGKLKRHFAEEL